MLSFAHSTSPDHILPTRISGTLSTWRTCSSSQIISVSSTVPMPPGDDDKRVGRDHEVLEAGEERFVLERLHDERIHVLLERQLDADADRRRARRRRSRPSLAACIRPGPPPVTMSHPIEANAVAARFTSS